MSVQTGIWNFDNKPADELSLEYLSQATSQHGPDGKVFYVNGPIGILYRAFHSTKEACREHQPYVSHKNNVITWDGRLDNREELEAQVDLYIGSTERTDVAIVAAAFDKWGTDCFAKLLGEWAMVIWSPSEQSLILAKDFMGTRRLYYRRTYQRVVWCTSLEPIVLLTDTPLQINGDFIAGYLVSYPAARSTPYLGIDSVPPCSYVTLKQGAQKIERYWEFDPSRETHYRSDSEYEEHFRQIFKESIRRRLRSHAPIVAELSGGMDSTSIVCVSDRLIAEGRTAMPRLDTISYYDDEEPNWDEKPYFEEVEKLRGRAGAHINLVPKDLFLALPDSCFVATPGANQNAFLFETEREALLRAQGNRVLLSGIGGDEVLGGVPTAVPELADLLRQFRLAKFASKLKAWSLAQKQPWLYLFGKASWRILRPMVRWTNCSSELRTIPWLHAKFMKTQRTLPRCGGTAQVGDCLPSQRAFLDALSRLADQLAVSLPSLVATHERRYPYLDRSLCEFLLSVPREQVVRPGQRRSLMRRAMVGIVPAEILERKRKAYTVRRFMSVYQELWPTLQALFSDSMSQRLQFVDENIFLQTVTAAIHGQPSNLSQLNRTIAVELWLRTLLAKVPVGNSMGVASEFEAAQPDAVRLKLNHNFR